MSNEENLIQNRTDITPEQRRANARKAGLASAAAKKRRKNMKNSMQELLNMEITPAMKAQMQSLGLLDCDWTYADWINVCAMQQREFVVINEEAARTAQNMMSFNEYQPGSRTKEYQEDVNEVYDLAEEVVARRGEEYRERAWRLATRYAKNLGKYFNEEARIGCMCPSVMISGAGNFPVKKKEKQVKAWDKNHEFYNYCQSIRGKLNNLLYSKEVIKSDDENAIEALEEKIDSLREVQENMKEINKYYRKHHTLEGCDLLTEKQLQKLQGSMDQFGYDRSPYPSWALQNNLANIKRCQQRVDELKKTKEKGTSEADYGDFKVIENTELMRIQIVFDGKPDEAIRSTLKANGFRWAPSQGAWQRQLTSNGKCALRRVIEDLGAEVQAS